MRGVLRQQFVQEGRTAARHAGDKNRKELLSFLDKHAATMPRITLRFAMEHFNKSDREHYLSKKKNDSAVSSKKR